MDTAFEAGAGPPAGDGWERGVGRVAGCPLEPAAAELVREGAARVRQVRQGLLEAGRRLGAWADDVARAEMSPPDAARAWASLARWLAQLPGSGAARLLGLQPRAAWHAFGGREPLLSGEVPAGAADAAAGRAFVERWFDVAADRVVAVAAALPGLARQLARLPVERRLPELTRLLFAGWLLPADGAAPGAQVVASAVLQRLQRVWNLTTVGPRAVRAGARRWGVFDAGAMVRAVDALLPGWRGALRRLLPGRYGSRDVAPEGACSPLQLAQDLERLGEIVRDTEAGLGAPDPSQVATGSA
jgi:hypothetical protein